MSALSQILSAISSARSLGAQSIRFTVSREMLESLQLELASDSAGTEQWNGIDKPKRDKPKPDKPRKKPSRRKLRDAERDREGSVMVIDGCPIFVGDGDGMSYSWRK